MPTFLLTFALFMLGACAVVSSPVPTGKGKRIVLFLLGVALWVGAYIIVRSQQETLVDFLFSDWALSGALANQVGAWLVVFGFGWYVFIVSSVRTECKRPTQFDNLWGTDVSQETVKVFRPWPSLLVWIPIVLILAGIWFVPYHFGGYGVEPDVIPSTIPTATVMATSTMTATTTPAATNTSTPTATARATHTLTATPEPTVTSTASPTASPEPTQTPDPGKPVLACNGKWLHQEPVSVGHIKTLFELCADGFRFAAHEVELGWDPIPTESMTVMPGGGARLDFQMENGELLVNGTPFAEWLASQGGK